MLRSKTFFVSIEPRAQAQTGETRRLILLILLQCSMFLIFLKYHIFAVQTLPKSSHICKGCKCAKAKGEYKNKSCASSDKLTSIDYGQCGIRLLGDTLNQHFVGYESNKFSVGGLIVARIDFDSEHGIDVFNLAAAPSYFNGVADSSFHFG